MTKLGTYDARFSPGSPDFEQIQVRLPASSSADAGARLVTTALAAFACLPCRDIARIDIRKRDGVSCILRRQPQPRPESRHQHGAGGGVGGSLRGSAGLTSHHAGRGATLPHSAGIPDAGVGGPGRPHQGGRMTRLALAVVHQRTVVAAIVLNAVALFMLGFEGDRHATASMCFWIDYACVVFFLLEATIKIRIGTWRGYLASRSNRFDFAVVLVSLPVLVTPFGTCTASQSSCCCVWDVCSGSSACSPSSPTATSWWPASAVRCAYSPRSGTCLPARPRTSPDAPPIPPTATAARRRLRTVVAGRVWIDPDLR